MKWNKLKKIIEKNLKLLTRSKSSALIIIFGPIVLITLLGLAFGNTQQYQLNVGVYSPGYTDFTNSLVDKLSQGDFAVTKEPTEGSCIERVKTRESNVCLVFPQNLVISQDLAQDITFHVDYSNVNLVYSIISTLSSEVGDKAKEVSISLTQDLLTRLEKTEGLVDERIPTLVGLTQKSDTIKQEAARMKNNINNLNLTIETGNQTVARFETEIAFLRKLAYESMREADDLIDLLNAEINILRGNKTGIEYYLDKAEEQFADYRGDLSDSDQKMQMNIALLRNYASDVNQKLNSAEAVKGTVKAALDNVKTDVESSLSLLNQMQTSLNEMKRLTTTVEITSAEKIVNPLTTKIVPIADEETHFNYLFPTLIVLVVMITSILLASTLVMVEKKSKSFFRNYITPTHEITFLFGTYLTTLIIMVMQVAVFLLVSSLFFDTSLIPSFFKTPFVLFFIVTFFILTGVLIGIIFKSEELTTLASITVASVMLFFSSTILPLESMPPLFKTFASLNPFVISESLLKESILFNLGFSLLLNKVYLLIAYIAILALVCVKTQAWLRDEMFYNLHKSGKLARLKGIRNRLGKFGRMGKKTQLRIKRAVKPKVGLKHKRFSLATLKKFLTFGLLDKPKKQHDLKISGQVEQNLMKELDTLVEDPQPMNKKPAKKASNLPPAPHPPQLKQALASDPQYIRIEQEIAELTEKLKGL